LSEDQPKSLNSFSIQVIAQIGKIFGWSLNQIINNEQLSMNTSILGNIKFKAPKKVSQKRTLAYTFYSNYLGQIIFKSTEHLKQIELPDNPYKIREKILNKYSSINIENSLRFFWDAGIPVLSINEPGGFHGLFIRKKGRSLLIINHRTKSPALWLFSLFHELRHVILHQHDIEDKIVEIEDLQNLTIEDEESFNEEVEASLFSGAVLLGEAPDPLIHKCLEEANYNLPYLKQVVINVAKKEGVQVDVLANLVAFKVAQDGQNFWGSARNLQKTEEDIQKIARDVLLNYIDFSRISSLDLDLLRRALISYNSKT
ncbi:MAG: ImmA/IrrE family metallo-endopeptidase, partial [Candidatus Bathyarchaeota archaeon]